MKSRNYYHLVQYFNLGHLDIVKITIIMLVLSIIIFIAYVVIHLRILNSKIDFSLVPLMPCYSYITIGSNHVVDDQCLSSVKALNDFFPFGDIYIQTDQSISRDQVWSFISVKGVRTFCFFGKIKGERKISLPKDKYFTEFEICSDNLVDSDLSDLTSLYVTELFTIGGHSHDQTLSLFTKDEIVNFLSSSSAHTVKFFRLIPYTAINWSFLKV